MSDEQKEYRIPESIRKRILNTLKIETAKTGSIPFNEFTKRILQPLQINWRSYSGGADKMSDWLRIYFPEYERSADGTSLLPRTTGPASAAKARVTPEIRNLLKAALDETLDENGSALLSDLGQSIISKGIDRKKYTGEGLADWIIGMFPELHKAKDGLRLSKGDFDAGQPAAAYPPAERTLSMIDMDEDIRQMHAIARMGWWTNTYRTLKRYTGCSGNDSRIWSGIVARHMSDVFLGRRAAIVDTAEDGTSRVAFYTGMDTSDGKPVYSVLVPSSEGISQPLMLEDFCYPGEEENPELGAWLMDRLTEGEDELPNFLYADVMKLQNHCRQLDKLRAQLLPQTEAVKVILQEGAEIRPEQIPALEQYRQAWMTVRNLLRSVEAPEELQTTGQILEWCANQNQYAANLKQIEQMYEQLVSSLSSLIGSFNFSLKDPAGDREAMRQACERYNAAQDTTAMRGILVPYQQLNEVITGTIFNQVGQKINDISNQLNDHFGIFIMALFNAAQMQGKEELARQYADGLDQITAQLDRLDAMSQIQNAGTPEKRQLPSAQKLLEAVCNGDVMAVWTAGGGENPLENLILEDRLPEALTMANDRQAMLDAGYEEEARQQICARLADEQSLPEGHGIFNIGRRLNMILGDENVTAERYFLMGMFTDRSECCTELLKIYRRTEQLEKFLTLWDRFGSTAKYCAENHVYYIRYLRQHQPEQVRPYLDSHVFTYYLPEYAGIDELIPAPDQPATPLNPLEQALVDDDHRKVLELVADPEALLAMGYTDKQITQIDQASISENRPEGTAPYPTGMRIYLYQGNLHRLAEQYLWEGLARTPTAEISNRLVRLLANEQRWQECIRLYSCFASASGISNDSRQAYLMALLIKEPIKAQQFIRSNLQQFLILVHQNPEAAAAVDEYRTSSNEAFREFYESLHQICELLTEDYPRSVVLHDRSLRDMVTQPGMLAGLNLDPKQIETAKTIYQTGNYPQGIDAGSVARRAYVYLGNYHGIAERLARFALPAEDALELLWHIACDNADTQEQHLLLQNYPALHRLYPHAYGQYLFSTGQYELFLNWMDRDADAPEEDRFQPSAVESLQKAIAQLKQDPGADILLPQLDDGVTAEQIGFLAQLNSTLVQSDRIADLGSVLLDNFQILLSSSGPEDLKRIMTADGTLPLSAAQSIQARALEAGEFKTALYFYNALQVGDLAEQADEYCQEMLAQCEAEPVQTQLQQMEEMAKLYPAKRQEIKSRIYKLKIYDLLKTDPYSKEVQTKLSEALEDCPLEVEDIRQLIVAIEASVYAGGEAVVQSVTKLTDRDELQLDGLLYLHRVAMSASKKSAVEESLYRKLCQRYADALDRDQFPEELGAEAEMLCRRIILGDNRRSDVAFCLYRIELRMSRRYRAECVLRYLMAQPSNELGTLYPVVEAAAEDFWVGKVPSVLSTFRTFVQEHTPDEIVSYCEFCKTFADASDEDWSVMHEHIQTMRQQKIADGATAYTSCTETEGESLLKILFAAPDKADYWWACTTLPSLSAAERGKLLFVCGRLNPNMRKECVQFCVEAEQNAMLLQTLQEWINSPSPGPKNCRTYLADVLEQEPGFFARWTEEADKQIVLDILEQLCCDMKEDLITLPSTVVHTALNAISAIAVAIGSEEALKMLEQHLSGPMVSNYTEIGVATVLRLLLANRCESVADLLDGLVHSSAPIACRLLVEQLHGLSLEELKQRAGSYEHRSLWGLLLPDGNRPAAREIQTFLMNVIRKNRIQEGANVLNMLLDIFPKDYACCDALFILCKCGVENQIPLLHKALCGLICSSANGASYFRRDFVWNAKLLAGVNAIIKTRGLEDTVRSFNSSYDFNQEAGRFCLINQTATTNEDIKTINSIQRDLTHDLQNLHDDELEWRCQGILSWVTGDWTDFLYDAWNNRSSNEDVSQIQKYLRFECSRTNLDSIGFSRSLLRVIERLGRGQFIPFLQWVHLALTDEKEIPRKGDNKMSGKVRHVALVLDLINSNVVQKAGELPLNEPLEEYSLMPQFFAEYIEPCVGKDPELMYHRLWLMGALVDYSTLIHFQYYAPAQMSFRQGDDTSAAVYYEAMLRLQDRGLSRQETLDSKTYSFNKEIYEAYSRISRLKLGDGKIISKVSSTKFHIWSCINMVVALMCTSRGNEAMRMAESFAPDNRTLSQAIIRGLNPNVSDKEKMDTLQYYPTSPEKTFLAYLMQMGSTKDKDFSPYFFQDSSRSLEARSILIKLVPRYTTLFNITTSASGAITKIRPKHLLLTSFSQINPASHNQLPVAQQDPQDLSVRPIGDLSDQDELTAQPSQIAEAVLPAFARGLTPLEQAENRETLEEAHDQLPHFRRYYQERLELSERLYRIDLAAEKSPVEMLPSLIRFGLDYYDNLDLDNPEEFSLAYRSIIELVMYVDSIRSQASEDSVKLASIIRPLETAVENPIVYTILEKGHLSIQSLVSQFAQDRRAFSVMQRMIHQEKMRQDALETIYAALDLLVECYSVNSSNIIVLRNALNRAKSLIGSISYGAWQSLKNKLQGLIQNEVNSIDRRPILDLEIQNLGTNAEEDYLYGEIRNEGLESATDITLQVAYDDCSSDRLRLATLAPNEHVAFKIRYTAPEGAQSLRYTINWSYVFNGQTFIQPIKEQTLWISQVTEPTFPLGQYETQTITDFHEDENGVLGNSDFFGREKETEELRNLFRSGRFPSYNNAIVYGIRRAGKTTLLNYVQAYVSLHCDDAIIVKVDCLINTSTRLVQSLFIDRVLTAIQGRYPQYKNSQGWRQLVDDWTLPEDSTADRDPSTLELFYQELKQVTGKGLILMLDEVDNFFTSVEQQTSLDSYLFQVLSNMLCSASCQQAIHFIFCGSKYLLRYRSGDGGLSQLFQRFGSNIIEVGLIPKSEMQRMLRKPYEKYPEVNITDGAIDWIWEYTQGLVWHVKLLANMVLKHVRENRRSVVYPIDVKDNIHNLVQKAYCEQFFDGINEKEKDKRERLVVDAIQSMATTATTYVPRSILQQLLTSESMPAEYRMTMDQFDNAIDNLIKLKLVVYSETERGYRFPVDLYRLYFRSQQEFPFMFRKVAAPDHSFVHV